MQTAIDDTAAEDAFYQGLMAQIAGDWTSAERNYQSALEKQSDHHGALHHLASVLVTLDRGEEAVGRINLALEQFPDIAATWLLLGSTLHSLARYHDAISAYERALGIDPFLAGANNLFGTTLLALDRPEDALIRFLVAIETAPEDPEAQSNYAAALLMLSRAADAVGYCERALSFDPNHVTAMRNLGLSMMALEREEDALVRFQAASLLNENDAETRFCIGNAHAKLGQIPEAILAFDQAIALKPNEPRFYRARGWFGVEPAHFGALEELGNSAATLSIHDRIELHFALGTAYDSHGQYDRAMDQWIEGNALKRAISPYNEAATLTLFERIRREFTPELMQRFSRLGHPSRRPIFIVGMPRSGSTLIEQILASHPRVFGAGEVPDFLATQLELTERLGLSFPEDMMSVTAEFLQDLGAGYNRRLENRSPDAAFVIDKMLPNFRLTGLIHLALPHARIIHVRRDPLDTCLSCFSTLFTGAQPYSYDLAELGRYYRAYRKLMDHWTDILPESVMIDIHYEDVIHDTERQARRIVAHLDLEWDDACLSFHQSKRTVRTASIAQVRKNIYRTSMGRSRKYEPYIGSLTDELRTYTYIIL